MGLKTIAIYEPHVFTDKGYPNVSLTPLIDIVPRDLGYDQATKRHSMPNLTG